ncbi:MAG: class I SAM-dependent RNA methyltransferase [Qingshengfaniella sp.]
MNVPSLDIFLVAPPGLEALLADEARDRGFADVVAGPGGVSVRGGWPEVWRANLELRGAGRVLVRLGAFRALHLAQLDKRARRFPWADTLRRDVPVRVEATCRKSRIYHAGAAAQRVETAIREELGAPVSADARVVIKVRIEDDLCTISVDSSGEALHKRGFKQAVNKAPMRETLAALFLRASGYTGAEPVLDPMCGSGTFVIEAAEIALGLAPGRARSFAFEDLASFDPAAWAEMRAGHVPGATPLRFYGSDRDDGAIRMSRDNAARAGIETITAFQRTAIGDVQRPDGPPGLIIVNPPYGGRIAGAGPLRGLYGTLGKVLMARFGGWRVGVITSDRTLARATGLPFGPAGPIVAHGGLKVRLYATGVLI